MGDIEKIKATKCHVEMKEQEVETENYRFSGRFTMTAGFLNHFGDAFAPRIALIALSIIKEQYVKNNCADYLQVFRYEGQKFYVIDNKDYVVAMLPEEY